MAGYLTAATIRAQCGLRDPGLNTRNWLLLSLNMRVFGKKMPYQSGRRLAAAINDLRIWRGGRGLGEATRGR